MKKKTLAEKNIEAIKNGKQRVFSFISKTQDSIEIEGKIGISKYKEFYYVCLQELWSTNLALEDYDKDILWKFSTIEKAIDHISVEFGISLDEFKPALGHQMVFFFERDQIMK